MANHLLLRHHSVVGLIDRAEAAGLVKRRVDALDHRIVRLHLTNSGSRLLEPLLIPRFRPAASASRRS